MFSRLSKDCLKISRNDPDRDGKVLAFCRDFYLGRNPSQITAQSYAEEQVSFGANAKWIEGMLANPKIHDEDYQVLKFLTNPKSIVLDIGANWGYSAGAFIKIGVKAHIVSFEVISLFQEVLSELKRRYSDTYQFFITGLAEQPGRLNFVVPIVNGVANSGLCSAHDSPNIQCLSSNILSAVDANPALGDDLKLQFFEFSGDVRPLDSIIPYELSFETQNLPIEAIKIDVEGLECSVLIGGKKLLQQHRPLVLAEGANRTRGISDLMNSLDYIYAEREGGKLVAFDGIGRHANGFFLHKSRLSEYIDLGVLSQ